MTTLGVNIHPNWNEYADPAIRKKVLDKFQAAGTKKVRLDVAWASFEPTTKGVYDQNFWNKTRALLDEIKSRGMKAIVVVHWAPGWATGNKTTIRNAPVIPANYKQFGVFLGKLGSTYKDVIETIEMWNEPDLDTFWATRNPKEIVAMLKVAYPVAKAGSPTTEFCAPAPTYVGIASGWFASCYLNGLKTGITHDAIGVHPYVSPANLGPSNTSLDPSYSIKGIAKLREIMRNYGDSCPIIASEFGWSAHDNPPGTKPWSLGVTPEQQAQFLTEAMPLLKAQGVRDAYWYMDRVTAQSDVNQKSFGLLNRDFSENPAFKAYTAYNKEAPPVAPPAVDPKLEALQNQVIALTAQVAIQTASINTLRSAVKGQTASLSALISGVYDRAESLRNLGDALTQAAEAINNL